MRDVFWANARTEGRREGAHGGAQGLRQMDLRSHFGQRPPSQTGHRAGSSARRATANRRDCAERVPVQVGFIQNRVRRIISGTIRAIEAPRVQRLEQMKRQIHPAHARGEILRRLRVSTRAPCGARGSTTGVPRP